MTVAPLAGIISSYSSLAIPIAWLVMRPVRTNPVFGLLLVYSLSSFIGDRIPEMIGASGMATRVMSFSFTIIEFTMFTLLFYHFFHRKGYKRWVIAGSAIFLATLVAELQKFGFLHYSRFNAGMAVILVISYSFLLFHEWLMDDPMEMIYEKVDFWITLGILVYLSGSFFFFISVGKRWEQNWMMHAVCNLIKNILFTIAIVQFFPGTAPKKTF
jgi:hypothetical protein